jgi:D-3-phosphoglycerate dehydrogenase
MSQGLPISRARSPRPKVLLLDPIHEDALDRLRRIFDVVVRFRPEPPELLELVSDVDVIVVRSGVRLPLAVFEQAARLKVVARAGSGVDNIDIAAARRGGVLVFNVPGGSAAAVAELALGLMLAVMRKIVLADRQVRADVWDKPALAGDQLSGKTLGVVGFGNIGSRVATIAAGFSVRVLATVARASARRNEELAAQGATLVELPVLLRESDVVCVAVPLTEGAANLIGEDELRVMKPSAYLINVSRGGVVDDIALLAALKSHSIAGAGLDVHLNESMPSPFAELDNVVLTPHIGAMSADAQRAIGEVVVDSIIGALAGEPIANRVC